MAIARGRSSNQANAADSAGPSLGEIVGDDTYQLWLEMLKRLVPDWRTHRLAVVLAAMLQHAYSISSRWRRGIPDDSAVALMEQAIENGDPDSYQELLTPVLERLFADAGVKWLRISKPIGRHSAIEAALTEFWAWFDYPWE